MMKKTFVSSSALPSSTLVNPTVTSTTVKGYVQEYLDQAASSFCPSTNVNGNSSSSEKSDETVRQQAQTEKMDENCPPPKKPTQEEIIADLNQRVFRDAERRGVISPRWQ
jgi:hypothetical protein